MRYGRKLRAYPPFAALLEATLRRDFKPGEVKWILMGPEQAQELGMKEPWRTAVEELRDLIHCAGLRQYSARKYQSKNPGVWVVQVRRAKPPRRD